MIFFSKGIFLRIISNTHCSYWQQRNIRKPGFPWIVLLPTFKVGTQGDTALWSDDIRSLRPLNLQLAQLTGLVNPGWDVMEKEPVATACLTQRHHQQRSSTAGALQEHCSTGKLQSLTASFCTGQRSATQRESCPSQIVSSTGRGCCELSHLWLNHSYLGGWSEGQGQLLAKETRVRHIRVLTDPFIHPMNVDWIYFICCILWRYRNKRRRSLISRS